jgi:hypothetical protein
MIGLSAAEGLLLLNNEKPIFQMAVLDQGFTPDGNYVYATDTKLCVMTWRLCKPWALLRTQAVVSFIMPIKIN